MFPNIVDKVTYPTALEKIHHFSKYRSYSTPKEKFLAQFFQLLLYYQLYSDTEPAQGWDTRGTQSHVHFIIRIKIVYKLS